MVFLRFYALSLKAPKRIACMKLSETAQVVGPKLPLNQDLGAPPTLEELGNLFRAGRRGFGSQTAADTLW